MKIILKTIKQEIYELECEGTINDLKNIIQEKFQFDAKKLKIMYNNKLLNNEQILNELTNDDIITLNIMNIHKYNDITQDEEKICQADIKVEEIPQVVASIMKVICVKNPDLSKKYFENLKNDNPAIMEIIKKEEAVFKKVLYSPVTKLDKKIFKKFYNGEDINSIIDHVE